MDEDFRHTVQIPIQINHQFMSADLLQSFPLESATFFAFLQAPALCPVGPFQITAPFLLNKNKTFTKFMYKTLKFVNTT